MTIVPKCGNCQWYEGIDDGVTGSCNRSHPDREGEWAGTEADCAACSHWQPNDALLRSGAVKCSACRWWTSDKRTSGGLCHNAERSQDEYRSCLNYCSKFFPMSEEG